jgi:proton-translocating NADH-quinone oxidoreductase chain N
MLTTILTPFFLESFLFFSLPIILFIPPMFYYVNKSTQLSVLTQKKKYFFFSLRFVQGILVLTLLGDLINDYSIPLLHTGNWFFRQDRLTWFMNFFLTGICLYYTYLLAFNFSRTTPNISYIPEIPFLIICTLLSLRLFIATNDLMLMVILLEIASFCSIIFIGSQSVSPMTYSLSIESTIKYFIINAVSVSLLLFAICGFFYLTNSTNINDIVVYFYNNPANCVFFTEQIVIFQFIFFFAYLIKLGAAPLHQWLPDVYEGAETLVTCFLVIIISPALLFKFIGLVKTFTSIPTTIYFLNNWFFITGLLSIGFGTLGAFYQTRIKRFIAYSSLTHLGFMLLGISFNSVLGYFSFLFYVVIYVITNLGFFTFLLFCQNYVKTLGTNETRIIFINQLRLFIQTSFFFFVCLVICLFSFAGIPPFAGFFAKFFILSLLIQHNAWPFALLLIIAIITGTFMYLRFLKMALFEEDPFLKGQSWSLTLSTFFYTVPKTLVAIFADYQLLVSSNNSSFYKVRTIDIWQQWLLTGLCWLLSFITMFFFFFSIYSLGIFDLSLVLVSYY